jgi:hypothetical protein
MFLTAQCTYSHLSPLVLVVGPGFLLYEQDGWWLGEFVSLLLAADLHRTDRPCGSELCLIEIYIRKGYESGWTGRFEL